jgi:hypothetical protein
VNDFILLLSLLAPSTDSMQHAESATHSDMSIVVIQIVIAVLGSLIAPFIIYLMNRSRAKTDQLQTRADSTSDSLLNIRISQISTIADDLKKEMRDLSAKYFELQRSQDKQPNECSGKFVSSEAYLREIAALKEYVKLLYSAVKRHLVKLENDLDAEEENGDD